MFGLKVRRHDHFVVEFVSDNYSTVLKGEKSCPQFYKLIIILRYQYWKLYWWLVGRNMFLYWEDL